MASNCGRCPLRLRLRADASAAQDADRWDESCRESYQEQGRGYRWVAVHDSRWEAVAVQVLRGARSGHPLHRVQLRQGDFQWVANRDATVSCRAMVSCLGAQLQYRLVPDRELVPDEGAFAGWAELPQEPVAWVG